MVWTPVDHGCSPWLIIRLATVRRSRTRAAVSSVHDPGREATLGELVGFRQGFYGCLIARADALFELADAVLCAEGPVRSLVGLSLVPEHRRGHGALYDGINCGRVDIARLRNLVAAQRLPKTADGRIGLAVDV